MYITWKMARRHRYSLLCNCNLFSNASTNHKSDISILSSGNVNTVRWCVHEHRLSKVTNKQMNDMNQWALPFSLTEQRVRFCFIDPLAMQDVINSISDSSIGSDSESVQCPTECLLISRRCEPPAMFSSDFAYFTVKVSRIFKWRFYVKLLRDLDTLCRAANDNCRL